MSGCARSRDGDGVLFVSLYRRFPASEWRWEEETVVALVMRVGQLLPLAIFVGVDPKGRQDTDTGVNRW